MEMEMHMFQLSVVVSLPLHPEEGMPHGVQA
jgi:hypothetical protein